MPAGTRPVSKQLTRIENQANRLRKTLGLTFAALAGGALIFGAVRNMAKFEESIAVVRAVTKATAQDFENLRDRAQELGITTRFSATQAADAMVLLARAGFSVDETMSAVGQTLLLAQAGGLGMAEAADIAASSLRGFGLEVNQLGRVTDVLVETANSANTNVSQLGQALKFVAPIARGLGQSIEITNAALGALSDAGLKSTLAGTGLRRVLAELASPGRELADILEKAGLTAAEVDPKVAGLTVALERLKLAGFDTADALEVFGQRGGPAFAVLVENIPKIVELEKALKASGGEAKRVADIMDNTLNGALFRAKSALEGLNLAIGEVFASPLLITFLNGITEGLRLAARNADLLQVALISLAFAGVVKLASVLSTVLAPAILKTILALIAFKFNVFALAGSFITLAGAMTVAPFIAVLAAVVPLAFAIQRYNKNMQELGKTMAEVRKDSELLTDQFVQQTSLQRELNNAQRAVEAKQGKDGQAVKSQIERLAVLTERLKIMLGVTEALTAAEREKNAREARGAEITESAIKRLERRRDALSALTDATRDLVAFQAELDRLEQQGATPLPGEKEKIRVLIETNSALAVQQKIFEDIKGPQRAFARESKALQALLDKGVISLGEFNVKLQEMKDALAPTDVDKQFTALDSLIVENQLLDARIRRGQEFADVLALEFRMRQNGIEVNDTVRKQIETEIAKRAELRGVLEEQADAEAKLKRDANREERQLDRLARRIGGMESLNIQAARLKVLFDQGRISAEEFSRALQDIQLKGLEASNELEAGFARAFIKIRREAEDLAAVGEKVTNAFADGISSGLAKAVEEGKLSFKDLARSILADLTRILIRLLVVQAISAVLGGGPSLPGVGTKTIAGNRQEGGTVQPGRSFIVGENGPELFEPNRTGTIVPNAKDAPQQAAPPIIQIVNVASEDDVPNAINDGGADDAIINAIARNKDRVSQVIS